MTLSDLCQKDVINTRDGRCLGKVVDIEFCLCSDCPPVPGNHPRPGSHSASGCYPLPGQVTALIVPGIRRGFSCGHFLRGEKEVIVIPWEMICKIGDDVILVDVEVC